MQKRLIWIDIAKAIGIICVIFGHCLGGDNILNKFINLFHMPLFFILSGFVAKESHDNKELLIKIKKSFVRLIIPCAIALFINALIEIVFYGYPILFELKKFLIRMFYGIANPSDTFYFPVGVLWFLFTLFWVEFLFQVINLKFPSKYNLSISFILGILGFFLTQLTKDGLPQNFDLVLICLMYYHLGFVAKSFYYSVKEIWKKSYDNFLMLFIVITFIFWLHFALDEGVTLVLSLGLINAESFFASLIACFCLITFCIAITNNKFSRIVLGQIGRNTLLILIIHHFDNIFPIWLVNNTYLSGVLRTTIDILLGFLLSYCINKTKSIIKKNKISME